MWKSKSDHAGNAQQDRDIIPPDIEDPPPQRQAHFNAATPSANFPQQLPPRPEPSRRQGLCPDARFCWPFSWDSWTLNTNGDTPLLLRRLCMWITLGVRVFNYVLAFIFQLFGFHIASMIVGIILGVLSFFFIAYCLSGIGNVQGSRRVLGISANRWHYDVFLLGSALIHIMLIPILFKYRSQVAYDVTWYGMWILIFGTWWTTTWVPEQTSYV
ncbi:hypothetical protein BKA67DRAFT_342131 [Truncatella angustata]|uniref:Uncharacterized protein n=1 Tax=Truncatella angustata TaxID=152316 RepID=A0A9P8ZWG5_9PEZI|nr:uncharacterized protein BKA67DRAFT_342131 [Truncatella angustata]KAH6651933.1 hypothetical protein BKA67DRAFT_342131 [Truncatella angustata]